MSCSDTTQPRFDASFRSIARVELAHRAWYEHAPGWLVGHATLFDALLHDMRWQHGQREMYGRTVDVPRLHAVVPDDGPGHPLLADITDALQRRYDQAFVRTSMALYRDGRDSVAWHGDTVARELPEALVATVSLGAPRTFMLRDKAGGPSIALRLGGGDLLVMGGTSQRTWQHAVPKVARAAPRIVVMFRPRWA
ncbi:MAG TPA: alpha-ketoglutarate-dependent dioxygenase AlkB [Nannocystaceae bacterium]|nr:alpha-ketoglutarate-dependent dioxygenase AlkB [Nannocystaceae bacterium]